VTQTKLQASAEIVSDSLKSVDDYLAFYGLANDYQEPERPNRREVAWIASEIRAQLLEPESQSEFQTAGDFSGLGYVEGRTFRLGISPGIISCRSTDYNGSEKTLAAAPEKHTIRVDGEANPFLVDGEHVRVSRETGEIFDDADGPSRAEITEWSAKSRVNMSRTLASLDYSDWTREDGALAMVTLTLPGKWELLAPDGKTFKKLIRKFEHRWRRSVGPWRLLWKLEFQRRGAPHWHALMRVPALVDGETFEWWLAKTWADVVDASKEIDFLEEDGTCHSEYSRHLSAHYGFAVDFSGQDFSDPRRIAMYFLGHSVKTQDGKEYQHLVPELWQEPGKGPGRFWGFCGLVKAHVEIELTQRDFDRFRREMRKMARARSWETAVKRQHGREHRAGVQSKDFTSPYRVRAPKLRKSAYGGRGGQNGGWVLLNDALTVASRLAGHLAAG
jgi:hypothetical protein